MPIPSSTWLIPPEAGEPKYWAGNHIFPIDWYLMTRWKITYALEFIAIMEYPYLLIIDDNTFILSPPIPSPFDHSSQPNQPSSTNLIQFMQANHLHYGVRTKRLQEYPEYTLGLWELTKVWMLTRNFTKPLGPLAANLLRSATSTLAEHGQQLAEQNNSSNIDIFSSEYTWNRIIYPANFLMISLQAWWENPLIHDYLQFIHATGMDLSQRWIEQDVFTMISHLFLPPEQVYSFPLANIVHGKPKLGLLPELGCPSTAAATGDLTHDIQNHITETSIYLFIIFPQEYIVEEAVSYEWYYADTKLILDPYCEQQQQQQAGEKEKDESTAIFEKRLCNIKLYTDFWCQGKGILDVQYCARIKELVVSRYTNFYEQQQIAKSSTVT